MSAAGIHYNIADHVSLHGSVSQQAGTSTTFAATAWLSSLMLSAHIFTCIVYYALDYTTE